MTAGNAGAAPLPIAITPGDPNGIGPEVALKAARVARNEGIAVVLVGDGALWLQQAMRLGLDDQPIPLDAAAGALSLSLDEQDVLAEPSAEGGRVALEAIERAGAGCLAGEFAAMVTAPISKESIHLAGSPFPGHTELLAARAGAGAVTMMLVREMAPVLRVALVTTHVPLRDVAALVTAARVEETLRDVDAALRADWGTPAPRLAMLGLNPHAGDGGVIGDEEVEQIMPALERCRATGIDVDGPFPADAFFGRASWQRFDAVVACYHDQGLTPFKALAQGAGVNVTCGLPFVRTSPDHGTAFDLAGKGRADESSMVEAIRLAARLAAHRYGRR